MKIREIMTRDVEVIQPDRPLQEAAAKMKSLDVGSLPVCDNRTLVGMLTDRDITVRAVAAGRDPKQTQVSEAMTPDLIYCFEDQEIEEAALVMEERQIRRLPILNRDHQLVGIVSLGDLAVESGDEELSGEVLEEVSEPAKPKR
ncbi:MAG TPA: CBS domain-containing protein [Caldilineaceae bacterium]|nr:CBS domain-containing protein [Caldilineaceae bacterium]